MKTNTLVRVLVSACLVTATAHCGKEDPPAPKPDPTPAPVVPPAPIPIPDGAKPPAPQPNNVKPVPVPAVDDTDKTPAGFLTQDQVVAAFLAMNIGEATTMAQAKPPDENILESVRASEGVLYGLKPLAYETRMTGQSLTSRTARDLRSEATPIKNQGQRGTCTAFATVGVIELMANRKFKKVYDLSEDHLWSTYGQPYTQGAINGAQQTFLTSEAVYPYNPTRFIRRIVPANAGLVREHAFEQITPSVGSVVQTILEERLPVVFELDVNSAFMRTGKSGAINPYDRSVVGGHAVGLVGAVKDSRLDARFGGGYFIVRNSWGNQGDGGYNYLPFVYCKTHTCYESFKPIMEELSNQNQFGFDF